MATATQRRPFERQQGALTPNEIIMRDANTTSRQQATDQNLVDDHRIVFYALLKQQRTMLSWRAFSSSSTTWRSSSWQSAQTFAQRPRKVPAARCFSFSSGSNSNSTNAKQRQTGTVKWFDPRKGFGYIIPSDGSDQVFVHNSKIHAQGYRSLLEGEPVEYETLTDDLGRISALHVTGPDGVFVKSSKRPGMGIRNDTANEDPRQRSRRSSDKNSETIHFRSNNSQNRRNTTTGNKSKQKRGWGFDSESSFGDSGGFSSGFRDSPLADRDRSRPSFAVEYKEKKTPTATTTEPKD